jgi:uncharacterized protein (DUF58 family)
MPKVELRLKARLLPLLVIVLLLLQFLETFRGWRILLVGLGGAWLVSYLWARSLARGLTLKREMRFGWVQVGDQLIERFTLNNSGRYNTLWVEVIDHSTLPSYSASRVVSVGGTKSVKWYKEAVCTRRGLFTLGPMSLQTGDPFGVYSVKIEYPISVPLLVMPRVVPLPTIEVAAGGRPGEGRMRASTLERTVSAAYVRKYQPGDQWRWIHWPTSAKHESLFVRLFDGAPAGDWWIMLDMNRHVHIGVDQDSTEEHEVILAASLADRGLKAGRAVGLIAADEELVWLPPQGGETQRWQILLSLAKISLGKRSLSELLMRMQPIMGRNTSLVIITPSTDHSWVEALIPLLERGVIPTVLLLDPLTFGGSSDPVEIQPSLIDLGVTHYLIPRDLLEKATAHVEQREDDDELGIEEIFGPGKVARESWEVVL